MNVGDAVIIIASGKHALIEDRLWDNQRQHWIYAVLVDDNGMPAAELQHEPALKIA